MLIGGPFVGMSFIAFTVVGSLTDPFTLYSGSDTSKGRMVLPDDGLDPEWSRRVMKVRLVSLLVLLCIVLWTAVGRQHGAR